MNRLMNAMRMQAMLAGTSNARVRMGTVSSYDPSNYAVKVTIQPEGRETGWLPIGTEWAGNSWGLFCPPVPGTMVEVTFLEGDAEVGLVTRSFFNDEDRPLSVTSGEFWIVHKSGSLLKFHNDGSVELVSHADLNATVGGQANLTVTGKVVASASEFDLTGNVKVTGSITATGDISDQSATHGSVGTLRTAYDAHTHPGVQTGGGSTGTTDHPV